MYWRGALSRPRVTHPGAPAAVLAVDRGLAVDAVHGDRHIRTAPARAGAPCRLAGVRQPHPHLLAHVFQITGFTWEDLGLREGFVHPGAQKAPRSPNAPEH